MVYVTRREVFSAAHRLYNPLWDDHTNQQIFGKCSNIHGHGHNYVLEVTVAGEIDPKTGYVVDLSFLKALVKDKIIARMDHKHLNFDVEFLEGVIPTAENLAVAIWKQLEPGITSGKLYSVKLYETENNYAEYRGEN